MPEGTAGVAAAPGGIESQSVEAALPTGAQTVLWTLIGPAEEIVAGRRPVEEAFAARRAARRLLVVPQRREALESLVLHATRLRIPVVEVEGGTLTAVAGFDGHQGVALVVGPRRWASPDDVLAQAAAMSEPPFVLVLDSLEDPQNMGTLLRSADACGVHGVIFPTRNAAPLTPSAVKASAGAVEHLLLVPVDDLPGTLVDLRTKGLHLIGTDAEAPLSYRDADLRGPVALVIGSEGKGMAGPIRRRLELSVRIPMRGHLGSLNAAVAGSILLFEAAAQRAPSQEAGDMREAVVGSPDKALPEAGRGDAADAATRPAGTRPEVAAETSGHPRETGGPDESRDGRGPADGTIRAAGGHDGPEEDLLPGR
ncbi:MAG: 23S rRNA (guanosine(2251)-2'-O)-methyltransferase RlmB [Candidatus Limnocylindrales bacterium]